MKPIIEELRPLHYEVAATVRQTKQRSGYTLQQIAEATGVSEHRIGRFLRGEIAEPDAYAMAAVCKFLGLSMDKLLLTSDASEPSDVEATHHIRELELRLTHQSEIIAARDSRIAYLRGLIRALIGIVAILSAALIGYMVFDIFTKSAGLVQPSAISPLFIIGALIVVLAIATSVYFAVRSVR